MKQALIQNLSRVAAAWLDPQNPLRRQALAQAAPEFCLSAASFELALDWIFSQWTESKLAELWANNPFKNSRYAVQILAGTTPAMIAQGLLQAAILNLPQAIKIPKKQPTFAALLQQSFQENAVYLPSPFELDTWQDNLALFYSRLSQADLVLAYGQDETLATLKKYLAPQAIFIAHGHAESAAIIFKEAANVHSLENLAYDLLSYDQRGCLSPHVTFIETGGELSPANCVKVLAEKILPDLAQQLPRGGLFPGEAAEILHQRNLGGFRGQVYCGSDWTLCYDEELGWPRVALPRFMPVKPFEHLNELLAILNPLKNQLISLGCAGPKVKLALLKQAFPIRFSELGEMQKQLLIL